MPAGGPARSNIMFAAHHIGHGDASQGPTVLKWPQRIPVFCTSTAVIRPPIVARKNRQAAGGGLGLPTSSPEVILYPMLFSRFDVDSADETGWRPGWTAHWFHQRTAGHFDRCKGSFLYRGGAQLSVRRAVKNRLRKSDRTRVAGPVGRLPLPMDKRSLPREWNRSGSVNGSVGVI